MTYPTAIPTAYAATRMREIGDTADALDRTIGACADLANQWDHRRIFMHEEEDHYRADETIRALCDTIDTLSRMRVQCHAELARMTKRA